MYGLKALQLHRVRWHPVFNMNCSDAIFQPEDAFMFCMPVSPHFPACHFLGTDLIKDMDSCILGPAMSNFPGVRPSQWNQEPKVLLQVIARTHSLTFWFISGPGFSWSLFVPY